MGSFHEKKRRGMEDEVRFKERTLRGCWEKRGKDRNKRSGHTPRRRWGATGGALEREGVKQEQRVSVEKAAEGDQKLAKM